jgi:hypothetical protein
MQRMEFNTPVSIAEAPFLFSYTDGILLLGSCFAEEMGRRLDDDKFRADVNPFGTLYNPASIASSLRLLLQPEAFDASGLFLHDGLYHSFAHHSRFSSPSQEETLRKTNGRLRLSSAFLSGASLLIVTFGTAFVYRLKQSGQVVSNCHKLPPGMFGRERLAADAIAGEWDALLQALWEKNPSLRVLFTVSPVRHRKDGAHAGQLSKATLLLAVEELEKRHPGGTAYFPAYEIMMDELRDYRFYAGDMLHPSAQAVEYICERFYGSFLTAESRAILGEWRAVRKAAGHKPLHPGSASFRRFAGETLLKVEKFSGKFPFFDLSREKELLHSMLK